MPAKGLLINFSLGFKENQKNSFVGLRKERGGIVLLKRPRPEILIEYRIKESDESGSDGGESRY